MIYFFYVHTTIRPKYMVLFHLFFLLCTTIRSRLGSSLIYFFYLHTTSRQKYMFLFIYSFFCARPFDQKLWSSLIYFLCGHTIIRPKIGALIDLFLFFLLAHGHSTKLFGPLSFILSLVHDHSIKN